MKGSEAGLARNGGGSGMSFPVEHVRLVDRVYETIRQAIVEGRFAPGERLVQDRLAAMLNVSRSPVREAVVRLAEDGYVRLEPYRGAVVTAVSREEMAHIYELREVLEPFAAARAAERATDSERQGLRDLVAAAYRVDPADPVALYRANLDFHTRLVEPCRNPRITETLAGLWQRGTGALMYRLYRDVTGVADRSNAEHEQIVEAFCRQDADEVARLVAEHLRKARDTVLASVPQS